MESPKSASVPGAPVNVAWIVRALRAQGGSVAVTCAPARAPDARYPTTPAARRVPNVRLRMRAMMCLRRLSFRCALYEPGKSLLTAQISLSRPDAYLCRRLEMSVWYGRPSASARF